MTNEMQLAQAAGLAVNPQELSSGSMLTTKPTGVRKIHRLLRGRYPTVVVLGAFFAVGGALLGYVSQKPLYKSEATIEINNTVPDPSSPIDLVRPQYADTMEEDAALIESPDMILHAFDQQAWAPYASDHSDAAVEHFSNNLDVETNGNLIKVTFSDPSPKVAHDGALAVCEAFHEYYSNQDPSMISQKLAQLDHDRDQVRQQLADYRQNLSDLCRPYNTTDLEGYLNAQTEQLVHDDAALAEASVDYQLAQAMNGNQPTGTATYTAEQIATMGNTKMASLLHDRDDLQHKLEFEKLHYGAQHPLVQDTESLLAIQNAEINKYVDAVNRGARSGTGSSTLVGPNSPQFLQTKIKYLQQVCDRQSALVRQISPAAVEASDLHDKIKAAEDDLDEKNRQYDRLLGYKQLSQDGMQVISEPTTPAESHSDRRNQLAALGFIAGGLFPAFVVVLVGLVDGRFRYSDEAHSDLSGVPLLGILPNLPDLLTDPAQAATAAHCVHQIRTILQITSHTSDRRVFAITSGSPGDGKTSLTLALGLSFAASGSRTLLIDGDLVGGGLTARLNVSSQHGVLEAMASRDIMPFIRATDVVDLSILPIGEALGGYTGTIAPAAVRRLIDEARKNFDIIIIDTGPVLGSIEASPIAVAADGVVLCVSRGQQRQLVDRALHHLKSIGAKVAGVVFNRAQANDFERSISRMSLDGMNANGNGRHHVEPIGPVAKAVASSVRSTVQRS